MGAITPPGLPGRSIGDHSLFYGRQRKHLAAAGGLFPSIGFRGNIGVPVIAALAKIDQKNSTNIHQKE